MNCDNWIELMSAALDGELTAGDRARLEEHLAACPRCAQLYEQLRRNCAAMRELDCQPPADLKERILSSLPPQEQPAKRGKVIHWKRWAGAAACLAIALGVGLASPMGGMKNGSGGAAAPETAQHYGYSDNASSATGEAADLGNGGTDQKGDPGDPIRSHFQNPQAIRVHYGATPEAPSAVIIGSAQQLETYLAGFDSLMWDGEGNKVPIAALGTLRETYTEDYFKTHRLLCVVVEAGSGSNRYDVHSVTGDTVTVLETVPEVGTCDMAAWLLTAEVGTLFQPGQSLGVEFTR